MSSSRPFRIWDCSRKVKKSLVASSLRELQQKGKKKLELDSSREVKVVLEYDGTLVDDEEYFSCLDNDTTLIILKEDEKWKPRYGEGEDETDSIYRAAGSRKTNTLEQLASQLRQDLSKIILFSRDQLQLLVDCDESDLSQLLGNSLEDAKTIQTACQRYLDEKQQVNDAVQLINILKNQNVDHVDGRSPNKKQRTQ